VRRSRGTTSNDESRKVKALVVLGSGGHTTEILALIGPLQAASHANDASSPSAPAGESTSSSVQAAASSTFDFVYCKAKTDTTSAQRLPRSPVAAPAAATAPSNQCCDRDPAIASQPPIRLYDLPRSREVGQSYVTSAFSTMHAFLWSLYLVWYEVRPDLLVCNGPGTCLPVCAAALLGRVLCVLDCPVVFVESLCRVKTLSLTGRILYPVTDVFAVHWTELRDKYPDSVLLRTFVVQ
jgi:beta-1,4-N-acetylglucosaminyltransferase